MKLKYLPILTTAAAAIIVVGCGGKADNLVPLGPLPPETTGGDSGGTTGVTPGTIPPGATMRLLQPGDMWKYNVTGRRTQQTNGLGGTSVPVTGTLTRTVSQDDLNGTTTLKITERLVYVPQGSVQVTHVIEYYVNQDAAGAITLLAKREDGVLLDVISTDYALLGTWNEAATDSGQTSLINDASSTNADGHMSDTFSVVDQQDVVCALGKYGTWHAEASQTSEENFTGVVNLIDLGQFVQEGTLLSSHTDASRTEFWNPTLGSWIRRQESSTTTQDKFVKLDITPIGPPQVTIDTVVTTLDITSSLISTTVH